MSYFELSPADISDLNDSDLREMVARLCEAELTKQNINPSCVHWGGAQEAADGGIDVRISSTEPFSAPGFINNKNTGFQVKKGTMPKSECKKEMLEGNKLKPVIYELLSNGGTYIIVSGTDDCSDRMYRERICGMVSAIKGQLGSDKKSVNFYGRDRLSAWLRQFPGVALWVRSRLNKPLSGWLSFGKWASQPKDLDDEFFMDEHPCVIDTSSPQKAPLTISKGIELIRNKLLVEGAVVRITGLSGVGKTRFAQALFEENVCNNPLPKTEVIYADLGNELSPSASHLVDYLTTNEFTNYVVLDNCPSDLHRQLQALIFSKQSKLRLLTIEFDISDDQPEETQVIHIEPSSEKTISKLVLKRFPDLGRINSEIIAEFSGGNARIGLALASRVKADETLTSFSDEELFKRLFHQRKENTSDLMKSAEALSLVYSFNINRNEFNDELSILSKISGISRQHLYRNQAELLRRQLAQQRGNWRAVLPHALANRLAKRALQNLDLDDINSALLKCGNKRLFNSCARRLGYLHGFQPAQELALSWMETNMPLHDIANCNSETLGALYFIAPIFPEKILEKIEKAAENPLFCSRNDNKNFSFFIRLLRKIGYEERYFDRAATLILRFAMTEEADENRDNITSLLAGLFSLYLSGTYASPQKRLSFVERMLNSGCLKQLEIAKEIFQSAFKTSGWTSVESFDFGARSRDFGWEPQTNSEWYQWYEGFIRLLTPYLESNDEERSTLARELLVNNFNNLWCYAKCFDLLEQTINENAANGKWPEIWHAIKQTIYFNADKHSPVSLERLYNLKRVSEPTDLLSQVQAYVLTNTWLHTESIINEAISPEEPIKKIEELGKLVVAKPETLEEIAPNLWEPLDTLFAFGKGMARGSTNQKDTFCTLVQLIQAQQLDSIQPILFSGLIAGVYDERPDLAKNIQELALETPELKPHAIEILFATPISRCGIETLIKLAQNQELEAILFTAIAVDRRCESIPDKDLIRLLQAINDLTDGLFITIQILAVKFNLEKRKKNILGEELRALGREVIFSIFSREQKRVGGQIYYSMELVVEHSFTESTDEKEVREIINILFEGVETLRLSSVELCKIIDHLIKTYPEYALDKVFIDNNYDDFIISDLFKESLFRPIAPLNLVPVERILNWCNSDQERIQKTALAVSAFMPIEKKRAHANRSNKLVLSEHIKALLNLAEDKAALTQTIFSNIEPLNSYGSRAKALENRVNALAELLNNNSEEVQKIVANEVSCLRIRIDELNEQEKKIQNSKEQRFE